MKSAIISPLTQSKKQLLNEVCLIRLFLIILLVLYHSFAPYCDSWKPLSNQYSSDLYWWIGKTTYSFMLEAFVFVSGYVYGYQISLKGKQAISFKSCVLKKINRLIIPSIIFSILYILCFDDFQSQTPIEIFYTTLNGRAHMWFLPMLFWCFFGIWVISKFRINPIIICIISILASLGLYLPLPFRVNLSLYYMQFFYAGYLVKTLNFNFDKYLNSKYFTLIFGIFTTSFTIYTLFNKSGGVNSISPVIHVFDILTQHLLRIIFSFAGVMMIFLFSNWLIYSKKISLSLSWINLSTYCFGVYLFQQFILQWLYYHTSLSYVLSPPAIPFIGFILTLTISIVLAHLSLKTKIGKLLIG